MSLESQKRVTFFLSTGRCATQWFADKLATHYGDLAEVTHEPFQAEYQSRRHFAAFHQGRRADHSSQIEQHLTAIEKTLASSHYIETGWPAYGVLPQLIERFADQVQLVYLYRDPIPTAASHTTHDLYSRDDWSESILLYPEDPGVAQPELAGAPWKAMSEFERCLFWCTELGDYAFRLRERFEALPWHDIAFESVFETESTEALVSLVDFLGLPQRESFLSSRTQKTDRWSQQTSDSIDTSVVDRYPKALEVRERLGYQGEAPTQAELQARYRYNLFQRIRRRIKKLRRG